jgi:hypothetical protein
VLKSFKAIARTLSPRQVAHVKEALLKGGVAIAHPGYKGKTIIVKPQISKKHIKNITGGTEHTNINKTKRGNVKPTSISNQTPNDKPNSKTVKTITMTSRERSKPPNSRRLGKA